MTRRASSREKVLLFSYGSNGVEQLAERLGHPVETAPAYLRDYKRVFRGASRRWGGGGVAHLKKHRGGVVYGLVAIVTPADLDVLDRHEGVPTVYDRTQVTVHAPEAQPAIAYVRVDGALFNPPSRAYLEACAKTVGAYWRGAHGRVTADDFEIA